MWLTYNIWNVFSISITEDKYIATQKNIVSSANKVLNSLLLAEVTPRSFMLAHSKLKSSLKLVDRGEAFINYTCNNNYYIYCNIIISRQKGKKGGYRRKPKE